MRGRQSSRKAGPLGPTISLQLRTNHDDDYNGDDNDNNDDNGDDDDANDANVTEPVEQCPDLFAWRCFVWRCNATIIEVKYYSTLFNLIYLQRRKGFQNLIKYVSTL